MTQSDTLQPDHATGPSSATPTTPAVASFREREFLLSHIQDTLRFYAPNVFDPSGGFLSFLPRRRFDL